jgi:hypothetical protein
VDFDISNTRTALPRKRRCITTQTDLPEPGNKKPGHAGGVNRATEGLHMTYLAKQRESCNENLFGWPELSRREHYPDVPGWKGTETSREAAKAIAPAAKTLRERILVLMREIAPEALTADQIAIRIDRGPFSVRPRVSELAADGKLQSVEERGKNESGMSATKWRAQ